MKETIYHPIPDEMFHVHTWRCKHAGEEQKRAAQEVIEEAYIAFQGNTSAPLQ